MEDLNPKLPWAEKGSEPRVNAQALLVQWPSMSFLIKLQSRSCVAVWATFIFPWWVEGTASSQEVRLLFLLVRGTERKAHMLHEDILPAPSLPPPGQGSAAARAPAPSSS